MKKVYLIIIISLCLFIQTNAQEADEVGWISKFGAAGGFNPVWIIPNIAPINKSVSFSGSKNFSESGMIGFGGSGYVYVMFIENLRIGGMGFSASQSISSKEGAYTKEVSYSNGFGGVTIEYTIPSVKRIAVSVGAIIGGGSVEINTYKNAGDFSWDYIFSELGNDLLVSNSHHQLTLSYFSIAPTINVDIPVNRFMAFRVGAGYNFGIGNSWKADNDRKLVNVPNDLNGNSLFFQTGIYFGFFAF
ncbi:MAG: hypothetical protein CO129_01365 [Ignavibacteriales bacterium CG_4_9_14_3_um_filter_34_10]|nr:MAG: hypothetical protein CO129_01365 [Ignavibacteriales bacterium CG_4_9_14_3_um_filter_34_10]